ncbi:MAG: N-acetyltransferase [Ruminococcus sp.]|nr:N-acetyltransferase [Ruminococcus sp.]
MDNFAKKSLKQLIDFIGEDEVSDILSDFSCPLNPDIEKFLKEKSIGFEKQRISATHLVFNGNELAGFYTFSLKAFNVYESLVSKSLYKRVSKYASHDSDTYDCLLPAPLLAQLGKNYNTGVNNSISGDKLLELVFNDIKTVQQIVGGKVLFLECEDKDKLIEFYSRNGFKTFAQRNINNQNSDLKCNYLIQMIKIIK